MKTIKLIKLLPFALLIISCKSEKSQSKENKPVKYLTGYWIPKEIIWGGDNLDSKDTGDVFRTAHFATLCFDTSTNKFLYLSSTQRHPKDYNDSIIFAGEPLVTIFAGSWEVINDSLLKVKYKPIEREINPPDTNERQENIKIRFDDSSLFFNNKLFHRTTKYDRISQQTIEEYKKHYMN